MDSLTGTARVDWQNTPKPTAHTIRAAAITCAAHTTTTTDLQLLLDMLGIR